MQQATDPSVDNRTTSFPVLWERQVAQTPLRLAVVSEDGQWTYADLDQLANRFAHQLIRAGVCPGDHIGLCVDRSCEAIASMLGVMKAGAAFVSLDPEYPVARLQYMLADASIQVVIGHDQYRSLIVDSKDDLQTQWIDCDARGSNDSNLPAPGELKHVAPNDVAYVMYTSGSTGNPKGVVIEHGALAAYCIADIDCYRVSATDRTLQFSTLNFDIAIEEIFPPLLTGSAVVVRPRGRANSRNELSSLIERFDVTAIHLATAYWHEWVDLMVASKECVPESVRLMIVTGEKVSMEHYRRWNSICNHEVLWCNAYGPTEATVSATVFIPDESFDPPESPALNMPIGKPLKGYDAYILDDELNLVAPGETGQLCIGGPALARGYLGRDDLTRAAFIEADVDGRRRRLYKTGDLSRWLPDGNIDFGGRIDHQIKLGSYRIEPAEIEAVVDQHEAVLESLVTYEDLSGKKTLIAYVATGTAKPTASEIAEFLKDRLPVYMVPSRFVFVTAFPKTINGKIDRRALPDPSESQVARNKHYAAATTERQRQLVELWQTVLNVPEVGIHDDFFLMGGSSLLVTQVVAKLTTEMEVELPVRDFFANPTIASLSQHLDILLKSFSASAMQEHAHNAADVIRERLPLAQPQFIESVEGRGQLFSVMYRPRSERIGKAVVLANSVGHEATRGYRNLQQLAVLLCQLGFDVLRFDYRGTGNSTGACGDWTCQSLVDDLLAARNHIASQTGVREVDVVGLRLGATIATQVPANTFTRSVLWDPIEAGTEFLDLLDRFHAFALTSLTRFNEVRTDADSDQRYGYAMPRSQRESLRGLGLNHRPNTFAVVSNGSKAPVFTNQQYVEKPVVKKSEATPVIQVDDQMGWDDVSYAESAFSSPGSFTKISRLLTQEC